MANTLIRREYYEKNAFFNAFIDCFTGCSNVLNSDRPNEDDIMGDVYITEIECVVQSGNKFSSLLT